MRVLFGDDQIPEERIPDDQVFAAVRREYPHAPEGFIRAFEVMRRAQRAVSEDNDVTVARRLKHALRLVRTDTFDVAIIDLGWYADPSVRDADRPTAGWQIAAALDDADQKHPERPPTAQIIYSARFDTQPQLAERAASKGRLPVLKPYRERYTIPLEHADETAEGADADNAACQSLRATISFIEHVRGTAAGVNRESDVLLRTASQGVALAERRADRWDRQTRYFVALGTLIVLAGVVSMFFLGVPEGVVTAAVGIVVGLVPRLMYGQLQQTREEIRNATQELREMVAQARSHEAEPPAI